MCMYTCVCVYIYIYTHTHTYIHVFILQVLFNNAVVSYDTLRQLVEGNMSVEHRWNGSDRGQPKYL